MAPAGDKNGDGVGDFWIGAPGGGKAYVFDGLGAKLAEVGGTAASNGGFGWRIAQTDNLGGDAGPDLLVGAPAQDAAYIVMLPPPNRAPVVAAGQSAVTVSEGGTATENGTVSDPDGDAFTLTASSGTVTDNGNGTWSWSLPTLDGPTDSRTVTITATDEHGAAASTSFQLVVANVSPSVGPLVPSTADASLVGTTVGISAPLSDPSPLDTHTATIDWGDGTNGPAAVLESLGSGSVSGSHVYATAGIYTVTVAVTDDDGGTGTASTSVVVYDPDAGFATAGGSVLSPAGADLEHPGASGKATFGLGARYTSTTKLGGSFELRFPAGDLRFQSTELSWLVVTTEPRAVLHGKGVLNGAVACSFTADLHAATVAIEISACSSGATARYSLPATPPSPGSIQIHLGK
jgi:hypothetical protein